jgi:hypothetical protein
MVEGVLGRPVLILIWGEDMPVSESKNVAGQVLLDLDPFGHEDLIFDADTHQAFIKRPMAEATKGKAVRWPVIMPLAPWFASVRSFPNIWRYFSSIVFA